MKIKAIETIYNGYKFRSRLEARWAVFLDSLNIEYQYEPEGFDLDGVWYLPDFWIDDWKCWVEIKPKKSNLMKEKKEYRLCEKLAKMTNSVVLLIGGDPYMQMDQWDRPLKAEYDIAIFTYGMIMLNDIDRPSHHKNTTIFDLPIHHLGNCFSEDFFCLSDYLYGHIHNVYYHTDSEYFTNIDFPERGDTQKLIKMDRTYLQKKPNKSEHLRHRWKYGISANDYVFSQTCGETEIPSTIYDLMLTPTSICIVPDNEFLMKAYLKARQARF